MLVCTTVHTNDKSLIFVLHTHNFILVNGYTKSLLRISLVFIEINSFVHKIEKIKNKKFKERRKRKTGKRERKER